MILVKFKDKEYRLTWQYSQRLEVSHKTTPKKVTFEGAIIRVTNVFLEGEELSVTASTDCHVDDTFVRETGRVISLKKLSNLIHPDFYTEIEKAYTTRKEIKEDDKR